MIWKKLPLVQLIFSPLELKLILKLLLILSNLKLFLKYTDLFILFLRTSNKLPSIRKKSPLKELKKVELKWLMFSQSRATREALRPRWFLEFEWKPER